MLKLYYDDYAKSWDQALPIGNGHMGAMVFDGLDIDKIQLNEDSIWSGKYVDRNDPDSYKYLNRIRELVFDEDLKAEKLAYYALSANPYWSRPYQTMGNLNIMFLDGPSLFDTILNNFYQSKPDENCNYKRQLSLNDAIINTTYTKNDTQYSREYFMSYPDDVMVIHLEAHGKDKLNLNCSFERKGSPINAGKISCDTIYYQGDTGDDATRFTGMLKLASSDGNIDAIGEHLIIEDATFVTLLYTASTSYRKTDHFKACIDTLNHAKDKSYLDLKQAHIDDYHSLFDRVSLSFDHDEDLDQMTTDKRLERIRTGHVDRNLISTYYQYGRYLMISGSRKESLPLNLQGIWCDSMNPSWSGSYTININLQMNYWLSESANLSECHLPLFDLLERMKPNGKRTAQVMYHCRGFVAHHATDIYGDTAPKDKWMTSTYWPMGAAWLCTHIWEHYEYTQDIDFLKEHYDTLYQAVLFFKDFLVEKDGYLVTCPTISPENTFITEDGSKGRLTYGPAMDVQILEVLFKDYLRASKILNKDVEFQKDVVQMLEKLPPCRIGKHGQIMEWIKDYDELEPGHRHVSQLYGLYPGNLFTYEMTPELMEAAKKTLIRRLENGGGHTGWSRAWMILLWARLRDKKAVFENIQALLGRSTYNNLMDYHPLGANASVFQIDGNLGGSTGITEMLVQCYDDEIILLPALPDELASGSLYGLKLRGNAMLDMEWHDNKVIYIKINSASKFDKRLTINGDIKMIHLMNDEIFEARY